MTLASLISFRRSKPPTSDQNHVHRLFFWLFIHLSSRETLTQGDCLCIHESIIIGLPHPQLALHHSRLRKVSAKFCCKAKRPIRTLCHLLDVLFDSDTDLLMVTFYYSIIRWSHPISPLKSSAWGEFISICEFSCCWVPASFHWLYRLFFQMINWTRGATEEFCDGAELWSSIQK